MITEINLLEKNTQKMQEIMLSEISDFAQSLDGWSELELRCVKNDDFYSQLIVYGEQSYGYIIRYCPKNGENEYVYRSTRPLTTEEVIAYDGGDDWVISLCYISDESDLITIVSEFIKNGSIGNIKLWGVLGEDA